MNFSNIPKDFFKNMNVLTDDVLNIIYAYIPKSATIFLNKDYYLSEHCLIRKYINKKNIEKYMRTMLRQDNNFVFNQLIIENHKRWLNMKNYYYKECIYGNYLNFLESYALDNQSIKCRQLIINLFEQQGFRKKQHKKNTSRYVKWRT